MKPFNSANANALEKKIRKELEEQGRDGMSSIFLVTIQYSLRVLYCLKNTRMSFVLHYFILNVLIISRKGVL